MIWRFVGTAEAGPFPVLALPRLFPARSLPDIIPAMPYAKIASQSELPTADEAKEFPCGDKTICVANVNGVYSALDNVCLHQGGPLGEGMIENGKVVCPWHGWQYDPQTGEAVHNRKLKVAVYPMKIEGGDVVVEV
jgi:nitrite reductase (NADH) small subunit